MRRMNQIRRAFLLLALGLAALGALIGLEDVAGAQTIATAQIGLADGSQTLLVGDPFTLQVTVTHPQNTEAVFPPLVGAWGDFDVRAVSAPVVTELDNGMQTTTRRIEAALFAPGAHDTPPLAIALYAPDGGVATVSAESSSVLIDSVLQESDTALRDIKPQATQPFVPLWAWVLGAGLLLLGGVATFVIWQRYRRAQPALPPYEEALTAFDAITAQDLPGKGAYKAYYTLVTHVVRRYCERRFGLHVLESTTDEVRQQLPASTVPEAQQHALLALLEDADLVKFADIAPDHESAQRLIRDAQRFVNATKPAAQDDAATTPPTATPPHSAEVMA